MADQSVFAYGKRRNGVQRVISEGGESDEQKRGTLFRCFRNIMCNIMSGISHKSILTRPQLPSL